MLNLKFRDTKHPGNMGHHENSKYRNTWDGRRRTSGKIRGNIFNKTIEEKNPNLKKELPFKA